MRVPAASAAVSSRSMMAAATPCGAAENSADARRAADQRFDVVEIGEFELRIGAAQMRERAGDRRAGLAVGQNGGDLELRMPGDQAQ